MSKTQEIDRTIELLNGMLETEKSTKTKLAITDRILRAQAMKLKHADEGKGTKFSPIEGTGNGN